MSPSQNEFSNVQIESSLPKPWEVEQSFNDVLYDWMGRAPWLAISAAAHGLLVLIFSAIPWEQFESRETKEISAAIAQAPEEKFEEPEEEPIPEELLEEPTEEPVLKDAEISDHNETDDDQEFEQSLGDPDQNSDAPFESDAFNDVLGVGGGAGGKYGGRFGGNRDLRAAGGSGTEQALKDGLEWLKNHQSPDGGWDGDGFSQYCGKVGNSICDGNGHSQHDVGLTGLALLAFLGDGNTTSIGPYKQVVTQGIKWLREQQDPDTGLIGDTTSREFIYDHAIATLALCEAYYFSKSPLLRGTAQNAVNYIEKARDPYGAWRYDVPSVGDEDTSITGWMVFALTSAKEGGLNVNEESFTYALQWIDQMTDPNTGRVGYIEMGGPSARSSSNDHYPTQKGEAMTAVGLLSRFFMQQDPQKIEAMQKGAELLLARPPVWDEEGFGIDMYYWYYGTYAMFQMGDQSKGYWKKWNTAMKTAILDKQRPDNDEKGSWDPKCAWGYVGGRIYSTALMVLCLEVYYRYQPLLGAR